MALGHTYVRRLRYKAVMMPYLCLVHSVRTKPSGHFLLITGPRSPNTMIGRDDDKVYTTKPCTPAIVEICGYENRMPDPMAVP